MGVLADAGRTFCTSVDLRTSLAGGRPTFAGGRLRRVCRVASGQAADRCGRGCRGRRLQADFLLAIWSWRRGTRGSGCLSTAPADRGRGRACYGCPAGAVLPGDRMGADRRSCPRRRREGRGPDQPARALPARRLRTRLNLPRGSRATAAGHRRDQSRADRVGGLGGRRGVRPAVRSISRSVAPFIRRKAPAQTWRSAPVGRGE